MCLILQFFSHVPLKNQVSNLGKAWLSCLVFEFFVFPLADDSDRMSDIWPALSVHKSIENIQQQDEEIQLEPDSSKESQFNEPDCGEQISQDDEHDTLAEHEILRDKNNKDIFVRKVLKSDNTRKKSNRVQNQKHACLFCQKLKSHIQDHMIRKHKDTEQVKDIITCTNVKKKEKLKDLLRAEGDHQHNKRVLNDGKGELLLFRRPTMAFDHNDYGPCLVCKEWMLKRSIRKHLKSCQGDTSTCVKTTRYVTTMSDVTKGVTPKHAREQLVKEVFTIMNSDDCGCVARKDELICKLGEWWLMSCNDNKKKRAYWASQHMRLMAKLLMAVQTIQQDQTLTMWDVLRPSLFESLVSGALHVSLPDMDDIEELKSPTNVIKLKYDLIRMCHYKSSMATQRFDSNEHQKWKTARKAAEGLLLDINRWWKTRCTKIARKVLLERKLTKKEQLPNPRDIQKLGEFLTSQLTEVSISLDAESVTYATYRQYVELVQARLLTYNKRRTGEIEDIM